MSASGLFVSNILVQWAVGFCRSNSSRLSFAAMLQSPRGAGDMTSTECYDLIKKGVDVEVPGLEVYYDKVVSELRGQFVMCLIDIVILCCSNNYC